VFANTTKTAALALAGVIAFAGPTLARDQIKIVGSSTVFPFATVVAEQFGKSTSFKTPVIESTGSGGGLKLFCAGIGANHPDMTNASRRIKQSEIDRCAKNGINVVTEVKVGYDGIVISNKKGSPKLDLSKKQVFMALAKMVPINGKMVANPYKMWSDIDPNLPKVKIEVLGPPPTSGTRDAFTELAMREGAKAFPMLKQLRKAEGKKAFRKYADAVREDGAYIEAGENDKMIVNKLEANPNAFGIFGFSFLDQNADKIQGTMIAGTEPTFENIASGDYSISRSLYFYIKKAHVGVIPGIAEYAARFTSADAIGEDGYLIEKGLIPLSDAERDAVVSAIKTFKHVDLSK
jgi:phosphate transport system substrate-binding protein